MDGGAAARRRRDSDADCNNAHPHEFLPRRSLCISRPKPNNILHSGDRGFFEELGKWYTAAESNAAEGLIALKAKLKESSTDQFWTAVTEGLAELTDAQYAFISKRMLVDDEDSAVEMPPFGQRGSCLMAQAFYFNDGKGRSGNAQKMKYSVYGCPCEHMKHDKILVIPERLSDVIPNNPNKASFIVPAEGYLALPLSDEGKCFAHFGVMWSQEGLERRRLSYPFMEMLLHSLEDVILEGFLKRGRFSKSIKSSGRPNVVIPHEAVTATQSLRPYARSLSHELRTPMQGVVGMLDVMYATVQEAVEGQSDQHVRAMLETLRENIEVAQDSSRRAVEAADNVVHAYDMNMGVPDSPDCPRTDDEEAGSVRPSWSRERRPEIVVTGDNVPLNFKHQAGKRRRSSIDEGRSSPKRRRTADLPPTPLMEVSQMASLRLQATPTDRGSPQSSHDLELHAKANIHLDSIAVPAPAQFSTPGLRHTNLREVLQFLVNDLLKVGGRPESALAIETEGGEEIEVRIRKPNGEEKVKMVSWSVAKNVPDTILIDEQDLAKMISRVFLNAVKFTEEGSIQVNAYMKSRSRYIVISVIDTGPGIPEAFRPNLFKPFSKEDDSLTRQSEGLGLGLLVARGLARKLGGDLACVRSETSGSNRGTEFEMRIPIMPVDGVSRQVTPFSSPSPSLRSYTSNSGDPEDRRRRGRRISHPQHPGKAVPRPTCKPSATPPARSCATDSAKTSPAYRSSAKDTFDRALADKHPLTFLVVEDNKINRKLLVNMLKKMGYQDIYEAYDGADAVRRMDENRKLALRNGAAPVSDGIQSRASSRGRKSSVQAAAQKPIDVVLMDLWMPYMDGYEAAERILAMDFTASLPSSPEAAPLPDPEAALLAQARRPTILAVTADATHGALERAAKVGMKGFLTKPYKLRDLERLILEFCATARPYNASEGLMAAPG